MADDEPSGVRPSPVVLRIKLRYEDPEAMVQRFAVNVGRAGLFLPTKSLQPVGAEIKFELRLANDTAVLVGLGRVKAARAPDPSNAKAAFGMAVELMRVTPQSRALILKMLERRKALGLAEVSLPMPEDVDQARRDAVESTGIRDSGPVVMAPSPVEPPANDGLLTAPRRQAGPIGRAKAPSRAPLPALAAESPRKSRPKVNEVVDRASGPLAVSPVTTDDLDESVDIAAAIARARALAGTPTDAELDALLDMAAAPLAEISVEAASAELARALGGQAISRKDRSAGWAPPPAVAPSESRPSAAITAPVVSEPPASESRTPAADAAPAVSESRTREPSVPPVTSPAIDARTAPLAFEPRTPAVVTPPAPASEPRTPAVVTAPAPPATVAPAAPAVVTAPAAVRTPPRAETPPPELSTETVAALAADTDVPNELDDDASLLVESEESIDQLVTPAIGTQVPPDVMTAASGQFALPDEEPHDTIAPPMRDFRPGMLIDDDMDPGQFERDAHTRFEGGAPLPDEAPEELGEDDIEQMGEHTMIGGQPLPATSDELADRLDAELAEAEAAADGTQVGEPTMSGGDDEVVDDFEILAEADASDADLLDAPTQGGVTHHRSPDNEFDYGRLDFGDDEASRDRVEPYKPTSMDLERALATDSERFSRDSSSDIRPAWDSFNQQPSAPYSVSPARPQPVDEGLEFDEPHATFDSTNYDDNAALMAALATPTSNPSAPAPKPTLAAQPSDPDLDLESALEELDVDFDDFGAAAAAAAETPYQRKAPVRHARVDESLPLPRRSSEGINIDFDDDE